MAVRPARGDATANRVLDVAERLVQVRGFNGFSYAALYRNMLATERLCLCGMLAAEYQTLPTAMQSAVIRFFTLNKAWLTEVLSDGAAAGEIQLASPAADAGGGPRRRPGGRHAARLATPDWRPVRRVTAPARPGP